MLQKKGMNYCADPKESLGDKQRGIKWNTYFAPRGEEPACIPAG
jgi:hypothetical protein